MFTFTTTLLGHYRVTKEKTGISQREILCPSENTLLIIFIASRSGLLVELSAGLYVFLKEKSL